MPIKGIAYNILFPLRGSIPDPSTYGINNIGKHRTTLNQNRGVDAVDDGRDDHEQNQRDDGGRTAFSAAEGVGALELASAAGLSKSGRKKISSLGKSSTKSIAAIDSKVVKGISEIYNENGAAAAASAANMNSEDVARVAAFENAAKGAIATVDEAAGDELEAIHAKEGIAFTRPSGAAAAAGILGAGAIGAVVAGRLSKPSEVKAGGVQQSAEAKIAMVDAKAVSNVASIYRENNMSMGTPSPTSTKIGVATASLGILRAWALAAKTSMGSMDIARIVKVENEANEEIKGIENQASDELAAIHEKEGVWFDRPGGSRAAAAAAAGLGI